MTAPDLEHQSITVPDLNATLDTLLALQVTEGLRLEQIQNIDHDPAQRPCYY
ncbi:hypothetical protein [Gallaecimonas xiamenensis]|uniref:hypothetical protein n=1 Tax=Gallaecimonas xiamenensis TaxID=1207039 RepID=UPI0012E99AC3|nr:hypothetical protein [Gallaecimonas xiamenensis]